MSHQTFVTVLCTVKKKTNTVPVECAEHEVPILRYIHGGDAVEIKERDYGVLTVPDSAEREFDRLTRKYDGKHDRNVVAVFGSLEQLAAKLNLRVSFDPLAVEELQPEASIAIDKGREQAKAAAKAAKEAKAPKAPKQDAAPPDGKREGKAA